MNRLLETSTPIPFEFLINGQFLRTSLDDFLTANGISAETTLNVEYVRALIPPSHVASFEHDDWVSSVDVLSETVPAVRWLKKEKRDAWVGQERIVSGCYDGLVRVWNTSGNVIATSASAAEGGHSGPVKAAKFLSPTQVVSASIDRTIRLWDFADETTPSAQGSLTPAMELYGHSAAVDALAVHAPSNRILSGSSDHTVGLWTSSLSGPAAPSNTLPLPSTKRRKLSAPKRSDAPKRGPLALLQSHTAPVSAVAFKPNDYSVAYSTSWDHSLKTWDLPTQTCVDTRATSHALLSVLPLDSLNLVAAGTSARHITLIDPRAGAERISAMTLRGHQNAVVSLAAVPGSEFGLVSGGHDGGVRVWDVRSVRSGQEGAVGECVFSVDREGAGGKKSVGGEGVKVFGVAWDERVGLVSGGEDKKIQIHREVQR